MKLTKIHIKNFMCYKDARCTFPNSKIVSIYGIDVDRKVSNGIGKSALKEAILFALYGKTKINLADIIKKGEDKCLVALEFEIDGKSVEIIRTYKRTSSLEIRVNGKKVTFSGVREKQKYIEELLELNYETCINFSIFDAIRFEDLSSLSSAEIKRLLQLLFNYEKFNKTYGILKDSLKSHDTLLLQLYNRKTHYFSEKRYSILHQKVDKLNVQLKDVHQKISTLNNSKYQLVGKVSANQNSINKNQKLIGWMLSKTACPTCKKPLDNKTKILNEFQSEINKCQEENKELKGKLDKIEYNLSFWNNEIQRMSNGIIKTNNWINKLGIAQQATQDINKVTAERDKYKIATEVMKKFEMYVMEHYISYLEQIINEYLTHLIDIQCKISFIKQGSLMTRNIDKFYMKLYRNNYEYPYMSLSSGERMLVAYAFKLAINTLNFKDNFLFIDEGLNRLDNNNRQKLLQLLEHSPFNQIFVISHDEQFKNIPIINITKQNNESIIKVENV